jgi:hypothetical protein
VAGWVQRPDESWSGPESRADDTALLDPPQRHDFGALGAEIELHNVVITLPDGTRPDEKELLLTSPGGLVRVMVDTVVVWRGPDNVLYESWDAVPREVIDAHGDEIKPLDLAIPEIVLPARSAAGHRRRSRMRPERC